MTVTELIAELQQLEREGYGNKEVRKFMPDTDEYEENAFLVLSVAYISMRHYGSDFVEIV